MQVSHAVYRRTETSADSGMDGREPAVHRQPRPSSTGGPPAGRWSVEGATLDEVRTRVRVEREGAMTTGSGGCDPSDDGAPGASSARRRARALVDGMVVGQAERARSWAATLGAVADLVDALSAPDGHRARPHHRTQRG